MGMCVLIVVSYIFSSTLQAIVCRTHIYYRPLISGSGLVCANHSFVGTTRWASDCLVKNSIFSTTMAIFGFNKLRRGRVTIELDRLCLGGLSSCQISYNNCRSIVRPASTINRCIVYIGF